MNRFVDELKAAASRAGGLGVAACVIALAALLISVVLLGRTVAGLPWGKPVASESLRDPTGWANRYASQLTLHHQRVTGRSPFFTPPEPPPPPPPPVERREEPVDNTPPPPPPPPSRYGGPEMIAMMGDTVWFANDKRLRVGEEDDGVAVVATNPPWNATLLWRGIEFEVQLFERTTRQFIDAPNNDAPAAPPGTPPGTPPGADHTAGPTAQPPVEPDAQPEPEPTAEPAADPGSGSPADTP